MQPKEKAKTANLNRLLHWRAALIHQQQCNAMQCRSIERQVLTGQDMIDYMNQRINTKLIDGVQQAIRPYIEKINK